MPGFLAPQDERSFEELMRDLARDEREWQQSNDARSSRDRGRRSGRHEGRDQLLLRPTQGTGDRGDE
jgi:hypothetical protein